MPFSGLVIVTPRIIAALGAACRSAHPPSVASYVVDQVIVGVTPGQRPNLGAPLKFGAIAALTANIAPLLDTAGRLDGRTGSVDGEYVIAMQDPCVTGGCPSSC